MTPLYEVWGALDPQGYAWGKYWLNNEPVRLPLPWAREYAREIFERDGWPIEVRGCGKTNMHKVRVIFGAKPWMSKVVDQ